MSIQRSQYWAIACLLGVSSLVLAAKEDETIVNHVNMMNHGDGHLMDMDGAMVMGQNDDRLPAGCSKISEDREITVRAGRKYSKPYPGTIFGMSEHEWKIKPCTRLTVHFINEDHVRHQWMMHGLPKFMYDKGMFHLEVSGPGQVSGTLIFPNEDKTYLVHCDMAQHMEHGMKGQLIVGKGNGTFPSIPGISDLAIPDNYTPGADGKVQPAVIPPEIAMLTEKPGELGAAGAMGAAPPPPSSQSSAAAGSAAGGMTMKPVQVSTPAAGSQSTWFSGTTLLGLLAGLIGTPWLLRMVSEKKLRWEQVKPLLRDAEALVRIAFDRLLIAIGRLADRISRPRR